MFSFVAPFRYDKRLRLIKAKITNIGYIIMKQPSNKNRTGGRYPHFNNHRRNNVNMPNKNTVFDSSGPCGRMRGTAIQLSEKYQTAAKDARHNDTVLSEICMQYADHYQRIYAMACAHDKQPTAQTDANTAQETPLPVQETVEDEAKEEQQETTSPQPDTLPDLSFMSTPLPPTEEQTPVKQVRRPRKPKTVEQAPTEQISA